MNIKRYKLSLIGMCLWLIGSTLSYAQAPFVAAREHINLTNWVFHKGILHNAQKPSFDASAWEPVTVPHTYSMDAINGLGYYRGEAWYRTRVDLPVTMANQRIFIRFEAVGQQAQVYINGQFVGNHAGGYSAFCWDISRFVTVGQTNLVALKVSNEADFKIIPVNDKLFNLYGGIYRPVQLFSTPPLAISSTYYASSGVFVEPKDISAQAALLEVRTHVTTTLPTSECKLDYKVFDDKNTLVAQQTMQVNQLKGDSVLTTLIKLQKPVLWNGRNNPHLYRVVVAISNGTYNDEVSQSFGIRTFRVDAATGSYLNNSPYRLYGAAMHQEWQNTGPALTNEQHKQDMALVNEMGSTALRLSHYQHSDITYQLADEMGICVWAEIPFVHDYSGREGANAKQQLTELIIQNYNHPSIVLWGLWNEVRAYDNDNEPCVGLTKELNALAHQLDPQRLTTSASDREVVGNMENITDLQAWNKYFGWYYGQYGDLATWLDQGHQKHPTIAIGISEYGAGGNVNHQDISLLDKPFGQFFPEQDLTLCHEVSWKIIKDRPYVWSSFVWNMFNFSVGGWNRGGISNLNHKGLISYDRELKKDVFYFYKANWSTEPVLYITERRHAERSSPLTTVKVYTNLAAVTLWVNGKKISTQKLTSDIKIIEFKNVKLNTQQNTIKITAGKFNDEVVWSFKP